MTDPKRTQKTPEKGGRKSDQSTRPDEERKGGRNPEPHKKRESEAGKEGRRF